MDKQKQIEEMAKILRQHICQDKPCDECNYHGKTKILPRYCDAYLHSKTLYNAGYRKIPEGAVVLTRDKYEYKDKKIYLNGKYLGSIDFSFYDDIKALGIGNFEIIDKRKGYGSLVIKDIIEKYKDKYDLIYCFVDKENIGAIEFYKTIGKVCFGKINDKNQYYVILYENEIVKARKETAEKFAERLKARLNIPVDYLDEKDIDEICKEITEGKA